MCKDYGNPTRCYFVRIWLSCCIKSPELESIKFEYYQPKVCPKWSVFLSTDRLTPNFDSVLKFEIFQSGSEFSVANTGVTLAP